MAKKEDFSKFRREQEMAEEQKLRETIENDPQISKSIKRHIKRKEGLSPMALVSLIVSLEESSRDIPEDQLEELELLGYMADGKLTEEGESFVNSEETIERLKSLIA